MPFYKSDKKELQRSRKLENLAHKNGLRHVIFNTVGDKYIGEWEENKKGGKGSLTTKSNGEIYEGDFKNNVRHGFGVLAHKLPKLNVYRLSYRGDWKNGKQHGQGVRVYIDGGFYIGNWKNGKRDGFGQMWYSDGSYYEGGWVKGLRQGIGLQVLKNGNRYEGSWQDDMKNGKGLFYFLDVGQLQEGIWFKDICTFSTISGLSYRQTAIKPTSFPILPNCLVYMNDICATEEIRALKGLTENCMQPEDDVVSGSSNTKKNESIK